MFELKKHSLEHLGQLDILIQAFRESSSSPLSYERRLNIINLLSGLCECENTDVLGLLNQFTTDLVEKHIKHPKVIAFFLIAKGTAPRSELTPSESEIVIWAISDVVKHKELLILG